MLRAEPQEQGSREEEKYIRRTLGKPQNSRVLFIPWWESQLQKAAALAL